MMHFVAKTYCTEDLVNDHSMWVWLLALVLMCCFCICFAGLCKNSLPHLQVTLEKISYQTLYCMDHVTNFMCKRSLVVMNPHFQFFTSLYSSCQFCFIVTLLWFSGPRIHCCSSLSLSKLFLAKGSKNKLCETCPAPDGIQTKLTSSWWTYSRGAFGS